MSNVLKKSLQTTIFTTVISAAIATPSGAYTINNDLIDVNAVTPWSVSRAGTGAQAYCTLSKTFKKNIILTLAENTDKNLTFALDFQKNRFETQSIYNIILATDNGDSRSYELNPATEKAFILRVKNDPEFYQNLWASDALIVSVNTENYRFATADFKEGYRNISTCLDGIQKERPQKQVTLKPELKPEIKNVPVATISKLNVTPAALKIPKLSPAQALSQAPEIQNAAFRTERVHEIGEIALEVDALKAENASLKKALFSERQSYEEKISLLSANNDGEVQKPSSKSISIKFRE